MILIALSIVLLLAVAGILYMRSRKKMPPIVAQRVAQYSLLASKYDTLFHEQFALVGMNIKNKELHLQDIQSSIDAAGELLEETTSLMEQTLQERDTIERGQEIYDAIYASLHRTQKSIKSLVDRYSIYHQEVRSSGD